MKYREQNYEPRRSKTGLTKGAFGQSKNLRNTVIEEIQPRSKKERPKQIPLYKLDVNRLRTSKYSPNTPKLDTNV